MKKHMTAAIYARVSSDDQECLMQLTDLRGYCERQGWQAIEYVEKESGKAGVKRPVLERLMADARLRKFDTVVVWKIDRMGRSLRDFIDRIETLDAHNIRFIAPDQGIDTDKRTPAGRLLLQILGAVAEFERTLTIERVRAGIAQNKENWRQGRIGRDLHTRSKKDLPTGRPRAIFDRSKARELRAKGFSLRSISRQMRVGLGTIQRELQAA